MAAKIGADDYAAATGAGADDFEALPRVSLDPQPIGQSLATFLAQEFAEPEPMIEGIFPTAGNGVIGGEEKLGKTFYMLAEALAIGLGLPLFGRYEVPRSRRVLILEEEDNPRRTWQRLRALLRGYGVPLDEPQVCQALEQQICIAVFEGFRLDSPPMVARLVARLELLKPEIVYADPFRKLTTQALGKPEVMGPLLGFMDTLSRGYGFAWRLVHHYRRQQGARTGRGSSEIVGGYEMGAWVESSLYFEPIGRSHRARLTVQSKDAPSDLHLLLTIETEGPPHAPTLVRLLAEEDAGQSKADETDQRTLEALQAVPASPAKRGTPGVTVRALAEYLKVSVETVRRSLERLVAGKRAGLSGAGDKNATLYAALDS
jgi:hypothetical protein